MSVSIINQKIKQGTFILISQTGQKLGFFTKAKAIQLAKQKGLDVVLVSQGTPAICKIMDFGKQKYQKSKNQKKNKHNCPSSITKQIQLSYNTQKHDLQVKHRHVVQFLKKGNKVKYTMRLKDGPRQDNLILQKFQQRISQFKQLATWESISKANGQMSITMTPITKVA